MTTARPVATDGCCGSVPVDTSRVGHVALTRLALLALPLAALQAACGGTGGGSTRGDRSHVLSPRAAIAFTRVRTGSEPAYDVATADSVGRQVRVLSGNSRAATVVPVLGTRPAWSPDARELAFSGRLPSQARNSRTSDIYVLSEQGEMRRITKAGVAGAPVWSPNRRAIVFSRREGLAATLWMVAPTGGKLRRLTAPKKRRFDEAESVFPDGKKLLVERVTCGAIRHGFCTSSTSAAYVTDMHGNYGTLVATGAETASLSPNGARIAFVSSRDRNGSLSYGETTIRARELYVADVDGTHRRRLTRTRNINERFPSWSADGKRIAFQRGQVTGDAEATSIWETDAEGTCARPLLEDPKLETWYGAPAWRPRVAEEVDGEPLRC